MAGIDIPKGFGRKIRSSKLFIYTVINLAVFIDAYIYGLIIPVLPFALVERVNLPEREVQQWIGILLGAYGAGLIVGAPIAGLLADRAHSRRGPYLGGLAALAISTLAFSVGRTVWVLFVGRLIQGISCASVHTVGMAILADTVGQAGIGPAMGFVTMSLALGVVLGPMLGGLLYHQLGYLAVFMSAYALVALDFIMRVLMVENKAGGQEKKDVQSDGRHYGTSPSSHPRPRKSSSENSTDPGTPLLSRSPSPSPSDPPLSPVGQDLPYHEYHTHHRHPILTLITTPRMLAALLGDFMQSVILTALESILPLRIKTLFGYNSAFVALVFLPLSLAPLFGPLFGHLGDRIGAKSTVSLGFAFTAPLLVLLRFVDHDGKEQVALLCTLLLFIGIALSMILTPVFSEATYLVDDLTQSQPGVWGKNGKGAYAQAFGLMNMAYAAGSLVGPLMGGFLVERVGWGNLMAGTGVACAVCVGPVMTVMGGRRGKGKRKEGEGSRSNETTTLS